PAASRGQEFRETHEERLGEQQATWSVEVRRAAFGVSPNRGRSPERRRSRPARVANIGAPRAGVRRRSRRSLRTGSRSDRNTGYAEQAEERSGSRSAPPSGSAPLDIRASDPRNRTGRRLALRRGSRS